MNFNSDIDIDVGDREKLLALIKHVPASMRNVNPIRKHSTGIYVTDIPYDPLHNMASIDYVEAEKRGYVKLDILNLHLYNQIENETELVELMQEPNWENLKRKSYVEQLIHLNNHYYTILSMPEPINSIPRLAMFLAIIRPGKKHLLGKPWAEVALTVWEKGTDGYSYKKAHAISYAQLVVVNMNLLDRQLSTQLL